MKTDFKPAAPADPATAESEGVIRKCVRCGFCTATCPTYVLLGDELDSPRGRIQLIKNMLETGGTPSPETVKHVDRCLSCLACVTTCPSGVDYRRLVDHARAYIEERHRRPAAERLIRAALAWTLPHPRRFRLALRLARVARRAGPALGRRRALAPLAAMLSLAPQDASTPPPRADARVPGARGRVALLGGCAEPVLAPEFRAAAVRLLNRTGFDVVFAPGEGCCGALVHHLGREGDALAAARRNVDAWSRLIDDGEGLAAIIVTASGCGSAIKDYGHLLRGDPAYAARAARVSALARDVSEFLAAEAPPVGDGRGLVVAYHAACSLQHGQRVTDAPRRLLAGAGYVVRTPIEAHLCCGSAGTYNILQPDLAGRLGDRKAANLDRLEADVIATGNIGCAVQIGRRSGRPVVHVVELLDWATGGPTPPKLAHLHPAARA